MGNDSNDERAQRYSVALTGWSSWAGDFDVESATASVMAVADAEQAELRAADTAAHERYLATKRRAETAEQAMADERVARIGDDSIRSMELKGAHKRAEAAEAEAKSLAEHLGREILKVARVEALADEWDHAHPNLYARELRAALAGADKSQGVDVEAVKARIRAKAATLPAGPL